MTDDHSHPHTSLHLAILLAVCALTFFIALGRSPVHRAQEVRVLETAREMLENHDLVVPRFCGQSRVEKPPLAYWLALGGFLATGIDEAGGRIYSALSGTLTVLLVYAFASSWGRPRTGLWAALILATSRLFLLHSRLAETDVLLTFAVTAAMYCFWRAFVIPKKIGRVARNAFSAKALRPLRLGGDPRELQRTDAESTEDSHGIPSGQMDLNLVGTAGWIALGWGAMAIGFLAKGPAALLFPLLSAVLYLCASLRWRQTARVFNPLGIMFFLALSAPWFIEVMWRQGMAAGVFWHEMAVVVTGRSHGPGNIFHALFYYPIRIWPDFAPWSLFLLPVFVFAWRCISAETGTRFFLAWTVGILFQLEVIGSRQPHYLLPVFPALASLSGYWLESGSSGFRIMAGPRRRRIAVGLVIVVLASSAIWLFWGEAKIQPDNQSRRDFAGVIAPIIRTSDVYFYRFVDPVIDFYLRRVIPSFDGGPGELDRLAGGRQTVFVIARADGESGAADLEASLAADPRFRLIVSTPSPGPALRLYQRPLKAE